MLLRSYLMPSPNRGDPMEASVSCTFGGSVFSIPGRLEALLRHGYELPKGAEDEIRLIKHDLEEVVAILLGQKNKKLEKYAPLEWMKEVRELSYDMEDFIDQYEHAAARSQSWSIRRNPKSRKIAHPRRSKTTPWVSSNLRQRLWMANKIREFSVRAQEALQRHSLYNLGAFAGTTSARYSGASFGSWHPRSSRDDAHPLIGIGTAMNKLEEWLLGMPDGEQQNLKVLSIVGSGGIGKTTLAKELYRQVGQEFECRAFVRLSRKPDMRRVFVSMLSQVRPHLPPANWKVHSLISSIRKHLQNKRYLIIIDELWATSTWDIIKYALPEENTGSRIITTTEIEELALQSCGYDSKYVFKMKPLGEDGSRELFFSTVFGPSHECPPELREVSCDIIRKCGGLPLAIVIIASILASRLDMKEQWDYINKSLGYNLMTNLTLEGMKQVLTLSFSNVPQNLKASMLYMSMYPEDSIIWKDDLMNQWIAEGFICATDGQDRQEISRAYFDELVGQNLIQPEHINDNGEVLSCTVHQMVHNFIVTYKSIEENFVTAIHHSEATITLADKVRRLSLNYDSAEDAMAPTNMRLSQVRTLAFSGVFKCMPSIVQFQLLQVLILHLWGDEGIISLDLTGISELFRLRYLKVASNVTLELRTHMRGLQYLETLKIDAKVSSVPSDLVHLPGLLHLSLPAETNLPNGISHMTSLRTLGYFDLSCNSTENVQSLSSLINLEDLHLTCSNAQEPCSLKSKMQFLLTLILGKLCNLKALTLLTKSYCNANSLDDAGPTRMIISSDDFTSMPSPPTLIRRLELSPRICIFSYIPECIRQLDNLCVLKIGVGKIVSDGIEVLRGLPNLAILSLYIHTKPAKRIVIGKTGFSVLKCFKFKCCEPLLEFEPDAMPGLRRLKLCFNASGIDEQSIIRVGIKHLSGIKEVSAKIGGTGPDKMYRIAVEVALKKAMISSGQPLCPRINAQCVNKMFGFMEDESSLTGGEWETPVQLDILEKDTVENEEIMDYSIEHDESMEKSSLTVSEGSTSLRRPSGGMVLSFFNQADEFASLNEVFPVCSSQVQGPAPTATELQLSNSPAACTSGLVHPQQRSSSTKNCSYPGCVKGARGSSRWCIAHGGGRRCQKEGCNKGAEGKTIFCKAHGGGRRCEHLGCTKSAEGRTDHCIAHGGGRRCSNEGCKRAARGKSGRCIKHGGGKRCQEPNCTKSAEGRSGLCIAHGGGRRCQHVGCNKGAQGSTNFCKAHGGGKRCTHPDCTKGAEGSTNFCKAHGGGSTSAPCSRKSANYMESGTSARRSWL